MPSINADVYNDINLNEIDKELDDLMEKSFTGLNVNDEKSTDILANVYKQKPTAAKDPEYEECLSCQ